MLKLAGLDSRMSFAVFAFEAECFNLFSSRTQLGFFHKPQLDQEYPEIGNIVKTGMSVYLTFSCYFSLEILSVTG